MDFDFDPDALDFDNPPLDIRFQPDLPDDFGLPTLDFPLSQASPT